MYGPAVLPATGVGFVVFSLNPELGSGFQLTMLVVGLLLAYSGISLLRLKYNERKLKKGGKKLHD